MGHSFSAPSPLVDRGAVLADPALTAALTRFVRGRVPPDEVDDIVQSTLADALASRTAPTEKSEIVPWVHGIARNKIADYYRRSRREVAREPLDDAAPAAEPPPHGARDLLRWAEKELPDVEGAERTLDWMIREGEGEKLEAIAQEAAVPAPRVRQRVARMRRHFRARWAAQLAAAALFVAVAVLVVIAVLRARREPIAPNVPTVPPSTVPAPKDHAEELRRFALDACARKAWRQCLHGLDAAKELDPAGDLRDDVQRARAASRDAIAPPVSSDAPPLSSGAAPPAKPSGALPPRPAPPRIAPPAPPSSGFPVVPNVKESRVAPEPTMKVLLAKDSVAEKNPPVVREDNGFHASK